MAEACELFEPDGNGHLGPVGVSLECWVCVRHGMVHFNIFTSDIRLEDNFGLFPVLVIATASPFCDLRIRP